jgi:hypothetical protein
MLKDKNFLIGLVVGAAAMYFLANRKAKAGGGGARGQQRGG